MGGRLSGIAFLVFRALGLIPGLEHFVLPIFFFLNFFIIIIFCFLGPHLQHMEVPRLGFESELHLPACTIATAMQDPSCIFLFLFGF